MTIVLAVDPGKITGYAIWNLSGLKEAGQLPEHEFLVFAEDLIAKYWAFDLRVVCESFRISAQTVTKGADAHWSIGQIRILNYWCRKEDRSVPFVEQSPAEAKTFVTDAKLLRLGWRQATPGGHRDDAVRHLVLYLLREGLVGAGDLIGG